MVFKFDSSVALRPQRPHGPLGTGGAQDGRLDFHTAPELCDGVFICHFCNRDCDIVVIWNGSDVGHD